MVDGGADVGLAHERFADEDRVDSSGFKTANLFRRLHAAFADHDAVVRHARPQSQRMLQVDLESAEWVVAAG